MARHSFARPLHRPRFDANPSLIDWLGAFKAVDASPAHRSPVAADGMETVTPPSVPPGWQIIDHREAFYRAEGRCHVDDLRAASSATNSRELW